MHHAAMIWDNIQNVAHVALCECLAQGNERLVTAADMVRFGAERIWRSPRTGGRYPVERSLTIALPQGERRWNLKPLFDDQELDSRAAGGPIYWEGAVKTQGGRGYLELTGYVMHAPKQTVRGAGSIPAPYGGGEADISLGETSFGLSAGFKF